MYLHDISGLQYDLVLRRRLCTKLPPCSHYLSPYFLGKCWGLRVTSKTWGEAQTYCASIGGNLAKMDSEERMTFLNSKMGHVTFWLGARDSATEGSWVWLDGSPVSWTYWRYDQPSGNTNWDCLAWVGSWRRWRDLGCNYDRYSVCEVKVSKREGWDGGILARCSGLSRRGWTGVLLYRQRPLWRGRRRL